MASGQDARVSSSYLRILAIAAVTLALCAAAISVWAFGPAEGSAAPGVVVGEVDVGGRSEQDIRAALGQLATELENREIPLALGGKEIRVTPRELGFALDVDTTTARVLEVGRERGLGGALRSVNRTRTDVLLAVTLDRAALDEVVPGWEATLIEDLPFDGALEIDSGSVTAKLPKAGRRIDRDGLLLRIQAELERGKTGIVTVPTLDVSVPIDPAEVERAAQQGRAILSGPITLTYAPTEEEIELVRKENEEAEKRQSEAEKREKKKPAKKKKKTKKGRRPAEDVPTPKKADTHPLPEPVEVVFEKGDLLSAFRAHRLDDPTPHFIVELDPAEVKRKLAPTVAKLYNASRDARIEIDDEGKVSIIPSRPGTRVDTTRLVAALYEAAGNPGRKGELPVDKNAEPKFTTAAAQALNIKGLVSEFTTRHACCQPRVKNIHRICDMLDGALVKPGDTFSVNAAVGPRTLSRGFVVAPSIGDGEMTETPGGGVSQFATTLYNALFDGGYIIRERQAHSFYFNRYPMGLEATLSFPHPDLVFYNDTAAAILLRCDYSETHIRVRLFGDNGGRKVDRKVSQPFNYTDPKIEYVGNPKRDPEKEKVKDAGSHGFSVVTSRIMTLPDGTRKEEKRTVKYTGKPRLLEVHPCKIPKGEEGHTGEKCPEPPEDEGEGGGSSG